MIGVECAPKPGYSFSVSYPPFRFTNVNAARKTLQNLLKVKRGSKYGEICLVENEEGDSPKCTTVESLIWIPKLKKTFQLE